METNPQIKKNIFIDCGSHYGEGMMEILDKEGISFTDENWDFICFEASKECVEKLGTILPEKVQINHKVVFIDEEKKQFKIQRDGFLVGGASTVMKETNPEICPRSFGSPEAWGEIEEVQSIDFPRFFDEILNQYEKIYLKIDIEGAEYPVLSKMIEEDTLKFVDKLWIEFHGKYTNWVFREEEGRIREYIANNNISFVEWK